jgi:methylated-DNA-protein-cysteine methyltransferase-like protein
MSEDSLYSRIYAIVSLVPHGYVTTYGEVARQAGCIARTVGFAMSALPKDSPVPWQREINSQGRVSPRADGDRDHVQRLLLQAEGVRFDTRLRVDLDRYGWIFASR